ncbi:MAG: hypothetical protein RIS35_3209, partial [Pseudomonadota bacterium]
MSLSNRLKAILCTPLVLVALLLGGCGDR